MTVVTVHLVFKVKAHIELEIEIFREVVVDVAEVEVVVTVVVVGDVVHVVGGVEVAVVVVVVEEGKENLPH